MGAEFYLDLIGGEQAGPRVKKQGTFLPRIGETIYTCCVPYRVTDIQYNIDDPTLSQEDRMPLVIAKAINHS